MSLKETTNFEKINIEKCKFHFSKKLSDERKYWKID